MKKLCGLILFATFALGANATSLHPDTFKKFLRSFTCVSPSQWEKDGFSVEVMMQGEIWENLGEYQTDWNGYFKILTDQTQPHDLAKDLWAFKANAQDDLVYDAKYKPRKYTDHIRFNVDFKDNAGTTQFIVPKSALIREGNPQTSHFAAFLIMNHIQDHYGATVPLDCF